MRVEDPAAGAATLFVDVGNSRIKWGLWQAERWLCKGNLPLARVNKLTSTLAELAPAHAWVSCVAGATIRRRLQTSLEQLGTHAVWITATRQACGLTNLYTMPHKLGPDRFAMLVACLHLGLAPCVVVGAGTAVTVDALDDKGYFLGGLILPGSRLMRLALADGTAEVRQLSGQRRDYPRTTGDGVETGIWRALAGAIESMRRQLANDVGIQPAVVLSGGEAAQLAPALDGPVEIVEDLVLEGLLWIARCSEAQQPLR